MKNKEDYIPDKYECYTKGENDLVVDNYYILKLYLMSMVF